MLYLDMSFLYCTIYTVCSPYRSPHGTVPSVSRVWGSSSGRSLELPLLNIAQLFTLWNFQDLRLRTTISPREFCNPISRLYNVSVQLQYSSSTLVFSNVARKSTEVVAPGTPRHTAISYGRHRPIVYHESLPPSRVQHVTKVLASTK